MRCGERSHRPQDFGPLISHARNSILGILLVTHILVFRTLKRATEAPHADRGTAIPPSLEPGKALELCDLQTQGNSALASRALGTCSGEQTRGSSAHRPKVGVF